MPELSPQHQEAPGGPAASPMSGPTEREGMKAQAAQGLQRAINLMEGALLIFTTQSEEGKSILSALNHISKIAGPSSKGGDMGPGEVKMLASKVMPEGAGGHPSHAGAPPPGGMPPGMPMGGPMPRPL